MLNGNDLPHELLLTKRQNSKLRNAFNNNMSTDLTLFVLGFFGRSSARGGRKGPPSIEFYR